MGVDFWADDMPAMTDAKTARLRAEVIDIAVRDIERGYDVGLDAALDAYVAWVYLVARIAALNEMYETLGRSRTGDEPRHPTFHANAVDATRLMQAAEAEAEE